MEVLYPRCGGLDVHQQTVVACARVASGATVQQEVRTFGTATGDLLATSQTVYVAVDAERGAKIPVPSRFRDALERGAAGVVVDMAGPR